MHPVVAELDTA